MLVLTVVLLSPVAAGREQWIELHSPSFVVMTNGSEKQARHVAREFESIREVFRDYYGLSKTSVALTPITIIAARDEDTFKALRT